METQSTQPSLMQLFTSLGLATDNSLTSLDGQSPEDTGFSSLLSSYLPNQSPLKADTPHLEHLSQGMIEESPVRLLNTDDAAAMGALTEGTLPLLGQVLPLEANALNNSPLNVSVAGADSVVPLTDGISNQNDFKRVVGDSTLSKASLSPLKNTDSSAEKDTSSTIMEEQGFHAQSLVSRLISNGGINGNGAAEVETAKITPNTATESAKSVFVMPQQVGESLNTASREFKTATSAASLTSSELEEAAGESIDRFLGAESGASLSKPKRSVVPESFSLSANASAAQSPTVAEGTVNLALAINVDPTSQTLDELVDGEVIEQGELETQLKTFEKKQDEQTLKLSKGQEAWGNALTERITMNAAQDIKQVTIHLDPPELGSLELKMKINDDQQTQVLVQVQNPQVKEALESSAHRLRDMLANEGLELSEFDVQTDAGRGEHSSQDSDSQGQGKSQDSDTSQNIGEEISVEIPRAKNNNLLDTFV